MSDSINRRIALYRKMAGLTQTEVAEKMKMKNSTYSQMERKGSINAERLLQLSEILGVTPDLLLYESPTLKNLNFSPPEPQIQVVEQSSNAFIEAYNPAPFIATHKEESIIKVLRNLPKPYQDEVVEYINQKYKEAKGK